MFHSTKAAVLAILVLGIMCVSASAQMHDPVDVFVGGQVRIGGSHLLRYSENAAISASQVQIDYARFAHELIAFITKEILPDAKDEYLGSSNIPSRLSASMPRQRSQFGEHCLIILAEIGSHVSPFAGGSFSSLQGGSPMFLSYVARAGTSVLALRQVWSALRNEVEQKPAGFSLRPKVGGRKVGAYLTFRW